MNCPKCGLVQHVDDASFCSSCGASLKSSTGAPDPDVSTKPRRLSRTVVAVLSSVVVLGLLSVLLWNGSEIVEKLRGAGGKAAATPAVPSPPLRAAAGATKPSSSSPAPISGQAPPSSAGLEELLPGLQWGDPPTSDMRPLAAEGQIGEAKPTDSYVRVGEKATFESIPFAAVTYVFNKNRLQTAQMLVSAENRDALRIALEKRFGSPVRNPDGALKWVHRDTTILYVSDDSTGEHGIVVYSTGLGAWLVREKAAENTARAAAKAPAPTAVPAGGAESPDEVFSAKVHCILGTPNGPEKVYLAYCLEQTGIKVRRSSRVKVYSLDEIATSLGVDVALPEHFELEMMNSSEDKVSLSLRVSVTRTKTGEVVWEDSASRYQWIRLKN